MYINTCICPFLRLLKLELSFEVKLNYALIDFGILILTI